MEQKEKYINEELLRKQQRNEENVVRKQQKEEEKQQKLNDDLLKQKEYERMYKLRKQQDEDAKIASDLKKKQNIKLNTLAIQTKREEFLLQRNQIIGQSKQIFVTNFDSISKTMNDTMKNMLQIPQNINEIIKPTIDSSVNIFTSTVTNAKQIPVNTQITYNNYIHIQPNVITSYQSMKSIPSIVINTIRKFGNLLIGNGFNNQNILTKEDLSKLGLNFLLSYGFVSNISYITCIISAWIAHGKKTGLSPLATGQWKGFMSLYIGLWAANNIIRPLRLSIGLFISPNFDKLIDLIQKKLYIKKRSIATGIVIFLVNICLTFSYLFGGLLLATKLAKVPLLP